MSSLRPEYIGAAQKAVVDTTFEFLTKTFDSVQQLVELNVQAVKSTLDESQESLSKGLSTQEPHELFARQKNLAQTALEKAQAYWRHVCEILSGTQGEFAALFEAQLKQYQNDTKNAPTGTETAVAAWVFPKTPG